MLHYLNMSFAESPASQYTVTSVWKEQVFNLNLFVHCSRPIKLAQIKDPPTKTSRKERKQTILLLHSHFLWKNQSNLINILTMLHAITAEYAKAVFKIKKPQK